MDILDKLSVIELKQKVLLILNSIKNDQQQYKVDNIFEDLKEILCYLDAMDTKLNEKLK